VQKSRAFFKRPEVIVFSGLLTIAVFFIKDFSMERLRETTNALQAARERYENASRYRDLYNEVAKIYFTLEVVKLRIEEGKPDHVGGHKYNLDLGITGGTYNRGKDLLNALEPMIDLLPNRESRRKQLLILEDDANRLGSQLAVEHPGFTMADYQHSLDEVAMKIQEKNDEIEAFATATFAEVQELKEEQKRQHDLWMWITIAFFVTASVISIGSAATGKGGAKVNVAASH
jgi:hypothetical protein